MKGSPFTDPGFLNAQHWLAKQQTKQSLSRKLQQRRSSAQLQELNILKPSERSSDAVSRDEAGEMLSSFFRLRPSAGELLERHVLTREAMVWQPLDGARGAPPCPRQCHAMLSMNDGQHLLVVGGHRPPDEGNDVGDEVGVLSDVVSYDCRARLWMRPRTTGCGVGGRYAHCAVALSKDLAIVHGGCTPDAQGRGLWRSDALLLDCSRLCSDVPTVSVVEARTPPQMVLPAKRAAHTLVRLLDGRCLLFGGSSGEQFFDDLFLLSARIAGGPEIRWEIVPRGPESMWPTARAGHSMSGVGNCAVLYGGGNVGDVFGDLWVFDSSSSQWSRPQASGEAPEPRAGHKAPCIGTNIYVFGGSNTTRMFNDLHVLDTTCWAWSTPSMSGSIPPVRAGHDSVSSGRSIFVFGGGDIDNTAYGDLHHLDTAFQIPVLSETEHAEDIRTTEDIQSQQRNATMFAALQELRRETIRRESRLHAELQSVRGMLDRMEAQRKSETTQFMSLLDVIESQLGPTPAS
mmetsp:Transcript_12840/g.32034  ORF Transcript_12840/g.32034 Transcript_12840/m.32034 type:complete len:515 (-) Transcript_12840:49-1593(-)